MLRSDTKRAGPQASGRPADRESERCVVPDGAQIVEHLKDKPPMTMLGHVTSSYWSPNMPTARSPWRLVKNGRNRMGQTLYACWENNRVIAAR